MTWTRKFDHITPALRDLYWIPIRQRILFEHAMIVFKCPHGLALSYLADDCVLTAAAAGRRHLRSADTMELLVWRSRTVIGARDFAVLAAAVWNSLSSCSVQTFAQTLKTFYASVTLKRIWRPFILCFTNSLIIMVSVLHCMQWYAHICEQFLQITVSSGLTFVYLQCFLNSTASLFASGLVLCLSEYFLLVEFGCQYQRNRLSWKTRL